LEHEHLFAVNSQLEQLFVHDPHLTDAV